MTLRVGISWLAPMLFGLGATVVAMVAELGSPAWIKPRPRAVALPQDPVPVLDAEKLAVLARISPSRADRSSLEPTQPTALHLRARGTLLGQFVDWVAIEDLDTGKMQSYAVGDFVKGARIEEITRSLITLREGADCRAPYRGDGLVRAAPDARQVSFNEYEIPRGEIDQTLAHLNEVAMQARIVPAFKDGVAQGFRLFSIRPGSLYERVGLRNGDTIKRINGYDLNSPEKALEAYSKLEEATRFELEVERSGLPLQLVYDSVERCPQERLTYLEVSSIGRVVAAPPQAPLQTSPGRFSVSRREVEQQLADLGALASAARVVPSGQGFKVFAVRPGSIVERLGIRNGDKLTRVNGVPLDNVDAVLELYARLRSTAHFELQLERDGAPVTQTYEVQ